MKARYPEFSCERKVIVIATAGDITTRERLTAINGDVGWICLIH